MSAIWKPHVTVAALVERAGRYLLVEEETDEGIRINQPAGHWEPGERLVQAAVREALEETAHPFTPTHLVGIYNWTRPAGDITYLRFAFGGEVGEAGALGVLVEGALDEVVERFRRELGERVGRQDVWGPRRALLLGWRCSGLGRRRRRGGFGNRWLGPGARRAGAARRPSGTRCSAS